MTVCNELHYVEERLTWMRVERIWPNGLRYLWTDAFGVVLLVSLYAASGRRQYLDEAEWLVAEVDRVLGRPRGIRIGEAPGRDGQYFHYLGFMRSACWAARFRTTKARVLPWRSRFITHLLSRAAELSGR